MAILLGSGALYGQQPDSVQHLGEVVVKAFGANQAAFQVPASVGVLSTSDVSRFSNTNILPALNLEPGVRMEERSPGSYRLSIRGSSVRSPFGVRNVKVYWNGLPLTDHGGNTYLNLLDFGAVDAVEIIKGPASSAYGAGNGGVVLLSTKPQKGLGASADALVGSYQQIRYRAAIFGGNEKCNGTLSFAKQESKGYRQHSAMARTMITATGNAVLSKYSTLSLHAFHTHLQYQTPGGLTQLQYDTLPSQARPASGIFKSAIEQEAAVYNVTTFGGLTLTNDWGDGWTDQVTVFASGTEFKNPAIRNYEHREERFAGLRTEAQYTRGVSKFTVGGELQKGFSKIEVHANNGGSKGAKTSGLEAPATLWFGFAQYDVNLANGIGLTAGLSFNQVRYKIEAGATEEQRKFAPVLAPRVAIMKKWSNLNVYGTVSRGYSPPTAGEIFPNALYNDSLDTELGFVYEVGLKGKWTQLEFNAAAYHMQISNALVTRRDANDAEYFVNAGGSNQLGVETFIKWRSKPHPKVRWDAFLSYTFNRYRYFDFIQNTTDFSGNALPGISPHVVGAGWNGFLANWYANATITFVDRQPLNDANEFFATHYFLGQLRSGYRATIKNTTLDFFAGIDNAFNQKYSLGNDINAAGNRYFNAAMPRNYYLGVTCKIQR